VILFASKQSNGELGVEAASSQRSGIQRSPQALFFHAARMSINQSFFFFFFL